MNTIRAIIAEFILATEIHEVATNYAWKVRTELVNNGFEHAQAAGLNLDMFTTETWDYCWRRYVVATSYDRFNMAKSAIERMLGSDVVRGETIAAQILR